MVLAPSLQPLELQSTHIVSTVLVQMDLELGALALEVHCVALVAGPTDVEALCHSTQFSQQSTGGYRAREFELFTGRPVSISAGRVFDRGGVFSVVVRAAPLMIASIAVGRKGREMYTISCSVGSLIQAIALPRGRCY